MYVPGSTPLMVNRPSPAVVALKALRVGAVSRPERCLLVAATGDEVLDWREMVARYPDVKQRIVEGSDHGLADFGDYIDDVIDFAIGAV